MLNLLSRRKGRQLTLSGGTGFGTSFATFFFGLVATLETFVETTILAHPGIFVGRRPFQVRILETASQGGRWQHERS